MRIYTRRLAGFTLIELMVVMAIAGIILAIAVPSYRQMMQEGRLKSTSSDITTSLQYARTESITRGLPITVCASTDGATCTGQDWSSGWIVFIDQDVAGEVDGTDEIIKVIANIDTNGITIEVGELAYIQFVPAGTINTGMNQIQSNLPVYALSGYTHLITEVSSFRQTLSQFLPLASAQAQTDYRRAKAQYFSLNSLHQTTLPAANAIKLAVVSTSLSNSSEDNSTTPVSDAETQLSSQIIRFQVCDSSEHAGIGKTIDIAPSGSISQNQTSCVNGN